MKKITKKASIDGKIAVVAKTTFPKTPKEVPGKKYCFNVQI